MATRSVTHFISAKRGRFDPSTGQWPELPEFDITGTVYKHWDGYPESMVPLFRSFLHRVGHLGDTRFTDPSYLAAKWVVFLAEMYAERYDSTTGKTTKNDDPLDFLSVGIVNVEPGDIEFRYYVDCTIREADAPRIGYQQVGWDSEESRNTPGATTFDEVKWIDMDLWMEGEKELG